MCANFVSRLQRQKQKEIPQINQNHFTPALEHQIDEITAGFPEAYTRNLHPLSEQNITTVVGYADAVKTHINPSDHYRRDIIDALARFARFLNKNFQDIIRDDVISFLDSFHKSEVGTHSTNG